MLKFLRKTIRVYFGFSKTETNGTLVLIFLMIVFIATPPMWEKFGPKTPYDATRDHQILDSLVAILESGPKEKRTDPIKSVKHKLFEFDPNTASQSDLIRLGLPNYLAQRVINYRNKGGQFRQKDDLTRIYGLDPQLFNELREYIRLPEKIEKPAVASPSMRTFEPHPPTPAPKLDINLADTTLLTSIRGIGPVRARRIIKYRNWLGGFVSPEQFDELWGFDSLALGHLQKSTFIAPDFVPRQIDIDTAGVRTMGGHPYISYQLAKIIVAYRDQHGVLDNAEELRKIRILDDSLFQRIIPYIKKSH